ncbi:MAG: hypothetical protein ABI538_06125 [Pseudoxanthomonas sp.]
MPAMAQVQRSFLNPSFETPALAASNTASGCYRQIDAALVPGWSTTHPSETGGGDCTSPGTSTGRLIELWRTNFQGVVARNAANFAELNANASSRIFQNICLINGESINWRFSHRGRGSATVRDVMDFNVGASQAIIRIGTTSNGAFNAPIVSQGSASAPASGGNGWVDYTGIFNYAGATGTNSLGFESISTGSGSNTVGNFLDNIQIELRPFVEFVQASSSTPESASNNPPTLRVNGTVFSAFNVTVQVTGGTATLGTDYTTPGNSTTLTIAIPAGVYDGAGSGSLFALPVTVIQDTTGEANETIQFAITPPGGSSPAFLLTSGTTCGGAAQTTWDYTIIDDDSRITVTKDAAAPVAVAGSLTMFDVVYTIAVNNPSTQNAPYTLVDTPGLDANVGIVSASSVRTNNGGGSGGGTATPTLTGSGPWSLTASNRTVNAGATDTYTLTVRLQINQGGPASNDTCATPSVGGSGLHNSATATLQATGNPTFSASACRNTPTPVWVTLRKQLQGRNVSTDQFQVRLFSGGIQSASATTSGSATPSTASTGEQVLAAGNTLQFEEALKANGSGADQVPGSYTTLLACTNATAGSTTVLPGGSGSALPNRQQWPEFTPASGDVLDCVVTNIPGGANLSITKTNTPGVSGDIDQASDTVVKGADTTYSLVVRNNGPAAANGASVRDTPAAGLSCGTATCAAAGASQCPAATGTTLATALQSGAGVAIPLLPAGAANTVTFTLTCQVQ